MDLLKCSSPCLPGFSVQGMVLVNPFCILLERPSFLLKPSVLRARVPKWLLSQWEIQICLRRLREICACAFSKVPPQYSARIVQVHPRTNCAQSVRILDAPAHLLHKFSWTCRDCPALCPPVLPNFLGHMACSQNLPLTRGIAKGDVKNRNKGGCKRLFAFVHGCSRLLAFACVFASAFACVCLRLSAFVCVCLRLLAFAYAPLCCAPLCVTLICTGNECLKVRH